MLLSESASLNKERDVKQRSVNILNRECELKIFLEAESGIARDN